MRRLVGVVVTVAAFITGCSASPKVPAKSYPLWSDGWRPGQPADLAAMTGRFYARLTPHGACAWLGQPNGVTAIEWPAGWRVRLHPAVLFDQNGKVVAREGDLLTVGGGTATVARAGVRCGKAGQQVWDVEGGLQHGALGDRLSRKVREQLLRVARQTARTNGAALASAEAVRSHRDVAVHKLTGDEVSGNGPVWVLQIKGTRPFTCRVCSVAPGVKRAPRGRYIIDIVKARTFEMTDFNLQNRPSDLGALGYVTHL